MLLVVDFVCLALFAGFVEIYRLVLFVCMYWLLVAVVLGLFDCFRFDLRVCCVLT